MGIAAIDTCESISHSANELVYLNCISEHHLFQRFHLMYAAMGLIETFKQTLVLPLSAPELDFDEVQHNITLTIDTYHAGITIQY